MNLAINARDAMPDGGRLLLETSRTSIRPGEFQTGAGLEPGDYAILSVSDNGAGIPREVLPYIFEPFFTTKPREKGTGLGLATVYSIVKQNSGHISVYSEEGKGTTFKIYWPCSLEKIQARLHEQEEGTTQVRGGHETILVAEDDPMVLDTVCEMLNDLGYQVIEGRTAREVVEKADMHQGPIHLLFTDVIMPGMNGRQLAELITERYPDIRVLFTSGYTENIIARHGILKNDVTFIAKPYNLGSLARMIRRVLES